MQKEKVVLVLFCICLPFFVLLLSYKVVFAVTPLSVGQGEWMNYFIGHSAVPGGYTTDEISHMQDVKEVMLGANLVFEILVFVIVGCGWYLISVDRWKEGLYYGGICTGGFVTIILLFLLIDFNSVFILFHRLFFSQGNWQFTADSLLIQTFPLEFFIEMAVKIFGLALVLALGMSGGGYWLKREK